MRQAQAAWGGAHGSAGRAPADEAQWEYLGPDRVLRGPYSLQHLLKWFGQKFLDADQKVRQVGTHSWVTLRDLAKARLESRPQPPTVLAPLPATQPSLARTPAGTWAAKTAPARVAVRAAPQQPQAQHAAAASLPSQHGEAQGKAVPEAAQAWGSWPYPPSRHAYPASSALAPPQPPASYSSDAENRFDWSTGGPQLQLAAGGAAGPAPASHPSRYYSQSDVGSFAGVSSQIGAAGPYLSGPPPALAPVPAQQQHSSSPRAPPPLLLAPVGFYGGDLSPHPPQPGNAYFSQAPPAVDQHGNLLHEGPQRRYAPLPAMQQAQQPNGGPYAPLHQLRPQAQVQHDGACYPLQPLAAAPAPAQAYGQYEPPPQQQHQSIPAQHQPQQQLLAAPQNVLYHQPEDGSGGCLSSSVRSGAPLQQQPAGPYGAGQPAAAAPLLQPGAGETGGPSWQQVREASLSDGGHNPFVAATSLAEPQPRAAHIPAAGAPASPAPSQTADRETATAEPAKAKPPTWSAMMARKNPKSAAARVARLRAATQAAAPPPPAAAAAAASGSQQAREPSMPAPAQPQPQPQPQPAEQSQGPSRAAPAAGGAAGGLSMCTLRGVFFPEEKCQGGSGTGSSDRASACRQPTSRLGEADSMCVLCCTRAPDNMFLPCGHLGHCATCLPDYLSNEEKLARVPACVVCGQRASRYMRIYC